MIRHVVMFTLAATDDDGRASDIVAIRERLRALLGVVPGLTAISFEPDLGVVSDHWDAVIVSEHTDRDALAGYQTHPAHVEAAGFIGGKVVDRATVDYEA